MHEQCTKHSSRGLLLLQQRLTFISWIVSSSRSYQLSLIIVNSLMAGQNINLAGVQLVWSRHSGVCTQPEIVSDLKGASFCNTTVQPPVFSLTMWYVFSLADCVLSVSWVSFSQLMFIHSFIIVHLSFSTLNQHFHYLDQIVVALNLTSFFTWAVISITCRISA